MRTSRKSRTLVGLGVAALVVSSTVVASARTTQPISPNNRAVGLVPFVKPAVTETSYVSITPCRIVDTKGAAAGKLVAGAKRDFVVAGTTGFAPQGGKSGGCGVPSAATAVSTSVSMTEATGHGYLKAWARATTEPTATALLFAAGSSAFTGTVIPLGSTGISVKPVGGGGRLVVDVTGYYIPPISAELGSSGGMLSGSGRVLSSEKIGTGYYKVTLDRDPTGCVPIASIDGSAFFASSYVSGGFVYANTYDPAGTPTDLYWTLSVTC